MHEDVLAHPPYAAHQNDISLHLHDNLLRSRAVTALTPQILGAMDTFSVVVLFSVRLFRVAVVPSRLWRTQLRYPHVMTTCREDQIYRILSRY